MSNEVNIKAKIELFLIYSYYETFFSKDNRNNYSKDDEKRHYVSYMFYRKLTIFLPMISYKLQGMGQGWSGNGDEKEPKHKSDLMAAAEG